jgi:hypothetical protein
MNVVDWVGVTLAGFGTIGNVSFITSVLCLTDIFLNTRVEKQVCRVNFVDYEIVVLKVC